MRELRCAAGIIWMIKLVGRVARMKGTCLSTLIQKP
jgi:hypothetical protein